MKLPKKTSIDNGIEFKLIFYPSDYFTGEVLDEERVEILLLAKEHATDDDERIQETRRRGNDPDAAAKQADVEQIGDGRDAVARRMTHFSHLGVAAHFERIEFAAKKIFKRRFSFTTPV